MYRETKIIDGRLMERGTLDGEWREAEGPVAEAVNAFAALDDVSRARVMDYFEIGSITEASP